MTQDIFLKSLPPVENEADLLLAWYRQYGRDLPWRFKGAAHPDPYAVWVSEIMLQQTTVKTVCGYFERWMKRFPTLHTLAEAPLEEVLLLWQGLGYYTRAKKMHQCARVLTEVYGGIFPADRKTLLKLPGIGPYTASSLCAFAFDQPETVVDGNVIRVVARYCGITGEVDQERIRPLAERFTPADSGADYASAIMDLGATVCTPAAPDCENCPWREKCVAFRENLTAEIPLLKKTQRKNKKGKVFVFQNENGELFIRQRSGTGLLSGLWELPWDEEGRFPFDSDWQTMPQKVRHSFTHIELELSFWKTTAPLPEEFASQGRFVASDALEKFPFSTLMKKVLAKLL